MAREHPRNTRRMRDIQRTVLPICGSTLSALGRVLANSLKPSIVVVAISNCQLFGAGTRIGVGGDRTWGRSAKDGPTGQPLGGGSPGTPSRRCGLHVNSKRFVLSSPSCLGQRLRANETTRGLRRPIQSLAALEMILIKEFAASAIPSMTPTDPTLSPRTLIIKWARGCRSSPTT